MVNFSGIMITFLHIIFGIWLFYSTITLEVGDDLTTHFYFLLFLYFAPRMKKELSVRHFEMKYNEDLLAVDILGLMIPRYEQKEKYRSIAENCVYFFLILYTLLRMIGL